MFFLSFLFKKYLHLKTLLSITFQLLDNFLLPFNQLLDVDEHEAETRDAEVPVSHHQCHPLRQHLRLAVHQQRVHLCGSFGNLREA